jgi:ABC-type multidrug transport system fused ATPase/permease subunit
MDLTEELIKMPSSIWIKTLVYMVMLSSGLTIGYIYLLKIANDIYKKKIKEVIYENADNIINKLDKTTMDILLILSKSLPLEKMKEKYNKTDEFVDERNNKLQIMMKMWLIGLVIILILLWKKENVLNVLFEVSIVYLIIGLVIYKYLKDDLIEYSNVLMESAFKNNI